MEYNFRDIQEKWQKYWAKNQTFKTQKPSPDKPKYYVLDMFPYPSGAGLHVGHPLGYIASDIYARYKRHKGYNVLHPQGYDSFGLPAEQYAIQTGQHPAKTTKHNIDTYRKQLDKIGFSFDWLREIRTSEPAYYRWTQWIFTELFNSWYDTSQDKARHINDLIALFKIQGNTNVKAACDKNVIRFTAGDWKGFSNKKQQQILLQYRLAYLSDTQVNWCPTLGTVLANDEIVNGVSERGGHPVIRKKMRQWSMRITPYAERLLKDLKKLDWPAPLKEAQTNWIGRSQGASVIFEFVNNKESIEVFTTRADTIFGVTFMVLAPEHPLIQSITTDKNRKNVCHYIEQTSKKSELKRISETKNISGVFTGAFVIHPFTGAQIPVWVADYVLYGYGTGAVMAVPCGDQRDYDFAKHFGIEIINIFKDKNISDGAYTAKDALLTHSDFLNNLSVEEAALKVIESLQKKGIGKGQVNYKLREAIFSRQRYWGEPFPVYYKDDMPQVINKKYLPVELPQIEKYLPTQEGNPPLANATKWAWCEETHRVVENHTINNKTIFPLELNTMPGWAGSAWYFNRYMDVKNTESFASKESLDYWQQVDLYVGGKEHATGHLLYARFWQKFLYDRGFVPVDEFAKKLINQGMILGTSAFVYRLEGENTFVSKGLAKDKKTQKLHAPIAVVDASGHLDIEQFKNILPEFKQAKFILENGKYVVGKEVEKMSKSKYNVVNPDAICKEYGADALRLFEMFLGPLQQSKPWNTAGISGVFSFLKKFWRLYHSNKTFFVSQEPPNEKELKILHQTIKKIVSDIEKFSFNTSVSTFMIVTNELLASKCYKRAILEPLLVLLSPYAPHIAEELWEKLGHKQSIAYAPFPVFEEKYLVERNKEYPVSFNGKVRFKIELPLEVSQQAIEKIILNHQKTLRRLEGKVVKKVIVVPEKIINIVY